MRNHGAALSTTTRVPLSRTQKPPGVQADRLVRCCLAWKAIANRSLPLSTDAEARRSRPRSGGRVVLVRRESMQAGRRGARIEGVSESAGRLARPSRRSWPRVPAVFDAALRDYALADSCGVSTAAKLRAAMDAASADSASDVGGAAGPAPRVSGGPRVRGARYARQRLRPGRGIMRVRSSVRPTPQSTSSSAVPDTISGRASSTSRTIVRSGWTTSMVVGS